MPDSCWNSGCIVVEAFTGALLCLFVKNNMHDKLLEQRINITFLVKLEKRSQNVAT